MDLSVMATSETSEDGAWMPVLDFDWVTPIGCSILVLGPDSKEAVAILDEEEKSNQKRLADTFVNKKGAPDDKPADDSAAIRKAVRLTKDWKDAEWDGKPFPFNELNATILYTKAPHVRNQVLGYWRDRANFTSPGYASWKKLSGAGSSSTTLEKVE